MVPEKLRDEGFELAMVPHRDKWTNKTLLRHIRGLLNREVASAKAEGRNIKMVFGASYMPFWRKSVRAELKSFQERVKADGGELILADLPASVYHKARGLKPDFVSSFRSINLDWGDEQGAYPILKPHRISKATHLDKPDPALAAGAYAFDYTQFHREPSG